MTRLTHKFSTPLFGATMQVMFALLLVVCAAGALGPFAYVTNAAPDDQVPFTVTGTAALTAVTTLPGGLTQLDFSLVGNATHLGSFTGPGIRIQNNQGDFTSSGA